MIQKHGWITNNSRLRVRREGKVYNMIINGGIQRNVVSQEALDKFKLLVELETHPSLYEVNVM